MYCTRGAKLVYSVYTGGKLVVPSAFVCFIKFKTRNNALYAFHVFTANCLRIVVSTKLGPLMNCLSFVHLRHVRQIAPVGVGHYDDWAKWRTGAVFNYILRLVH